MKESWGFYYGFGRAEGKRRNSGSTAIYSKRYAIQLASVHVILFICETNTSQAKFLSTSCPNYLHFALRRKRGLKQNCVSRFFILTKWNSSALCLSFYSLTGRCLMQISFSVETEMEKHIGPRGDDASCPIPGVCVTCNRESNLTVMKSPVQAYTWPIPT